jgi:hypothetical protein
VGTMTEIMDATRTGNTGTRDLFQQPSNPGPQIGENHYLQRVLYLGHVITNLILPALFQRA